MILKNYKVIFVPGNSIHVRLFAPLARNLVEKGCSVAFVSRDPHVPAEYRVASVATSEGFDVIDYPGFYETDTQGAAPRLSTYFRIKREIGHFVARTDFDLAVFGHDTASHFERIIIYWCKKLGKKTLLIQDSIRQTNRNLGLFTQPSIWEFMHNTCVEVALSYKLGSLLLKWLSGPYCKRPYGLAGCTMIAASGNSLKRYLVDKGVNPELIAVTGQPRFDGYILTLKDKQNLENEKCSLVPDERKMLLFCRQELDISEDTQFALLRDLIEASRQVNNCYLIIKLHPRDPTEQYYIAKIGPVYNESYCLIVRDYPLDRLLASASAVMAVNSTTILEAMLFGKPAGLIQYMPVPFYLPYDKNGAALGVYAQSELVESIKKLLHDAAIRNELIEKSKAVISDELFTLDGKSADRVSVLMEEILIDSVTDVCPHDL